jgi:hypothetical protein
MAKDSVTQFAPSKINQFPARERERERETERDRERQRQRMSAMANRQKTIQLP